MNKTLKLLCAVLFTFSAANAQVEPNAGGWKPWFISDIRTYKPAPPADYHMEIGEVIRAQQHIDQQMEQQIAFWNAGSPGYRWQELMNKLWTVDTSKNGVLANLLLGTAIYDATLVAWDTKYTFKQPRPFNADKKIKLLAPNPGSPGYPCEHSVAAGVAVSVIGHFYPFLKDSVLHMAQKLMTSRIAAGTAFPADVRAGFALGRQIAEVEIDKTKDYITTAVWDGKIPVGGQHWHGSFALFPTAGLSKTVVMQQASQFRPGPPPDYAKDMAELKTYKQSFRSRSNAFYFATQNFGADMLNQKLFEYNLNLNPPRAARIYAATAVAAYDAFIACWDAKYTYWGIRPDQYDTTYKAFLPTPPFPGYPSGHAVMCGMMAELYSYFFPRDRQYFLTKARDGAESRFQAGIHFRSDNDAGLELGKKVSSLVVDRLKQDGAN